MSKIFILIVILLIVVILYIAMYKLQHDTAQDIPPLMDYNYVILYS